MHNAGGSRAWARARSVGAGFVIVSILAGTAAVLTAGQKGNQEAVGEAAVVGQRVPGPSGGPNLAKPGDTGSHAVVDPRLAWQERAMRKQRFERMQKDISELASLTRSLQEEIEQSNENVLSVGLTEKARKIEKLAGRIRNESRF